MWIENYKKCDYYMHINAKHVHTFKTNFHLYKHKTYLKVLHFCTFKLTLKSPKTAVVSLTIVNARGEDLMIFTSKEKGIMVSVRELMNQVATYSVFIKLKSKGVTVLSYGLEF